MRAPALALRIMAGLFLLKGVCLAQWVDQIQTESDWETLYNQSYFDYNTYQLYRELAEGSIVTDSADFFQAVLGNPVLEILAGAGESNPAITSEDTADQHAFGMRIRGGQKIRSGESNNGYILFSGSKENAAFELKGRKGESGWEIERRWMRWCDGRSGVTVGNYDTDIGLGLSIGKFDYRPITGVSDSMKQPDDFVFPDNSFYNGIKIHYNRSSAMFSARRYPDLDKRFLAAAMTANYEDVTLGISGAGTFLNADGYERTLGSTSLFFADPDRGIRTELAYAESGIGTALRLQRGGFNCAVWHYDDSFLNLQSSGIARPDYDRFENSHFIEAFRQAQAGETGFYAQKGLTIGRLGLGAAAEIWKSSPHERLSLDNLISARYSVLDGIDLDARSSGRTGAVKERVLTEFGTSLIRPFRVEARAAVWSERGRTIKTRSFCYIFCSVPLKAMSLLNGRFRAHFDGDIDYFVEEILNLSDGLLMKVTYRWQESYQGAVGPLYLVLEVVI